MSYKFILEDMSEFINSSSKNKELNLILPDKFGQINCIREYITDEIDIFKTKAQANKDFSIQASSKVDNLFINIILDGKIEYKANPSEKSYMFQKYDTYIRYIDEYSSTTSLDKNFYSKGLTISIKNTFLEEQLSSHSYLVENIKDRISLQFIHKTTQRNIKLANELFTSPFNNGLHNIYLQSKVLELIYNQFNYLNNCLCKDICACTNIKLSKEDKEALHRAKDIILFTQDFPDLPTLAKKVAINEFKLKFGFKKLFNTTPGNMILEHKMIHAKQLLESTEYSVSEVAFYVGYKYQQSFSNAFFQFFGVRPKDIMKTRKYYY